MNISIQLLLINCILNYEMVIRCVKIAQVNFSFKLGEDFTLCAEQQIFSWK